MGQLLTSRVLLARASVMLAAQPLGALLANAKAFTLCFVRMTCTSALDSSQKLSSMALRQLQDMILNFCNRHIMALGEDGFLLLPAQLCASMAHRADVGEPRHHV